MAYNTTTFGYTASAGIQYTGITDSSADWVDVPNSTYFYDLATELVYFKDGSGNVISIFESGGGGGVNIYNTSDSITNDRVVDLNGNTLTFDATTDNTEQFQVNFNVSNEQTTITQNKGSVNVFASNGNLENLPFSELNVADNLIRIESTSEQGGGDNVSQTLQNSTQIQNTITRYDGTRITTITQTDENIVNRIDLAGTDYSEINQFIDTIQLIATDGIFTHEIYLDTLNGINLTSDDGSNPKSLLLNGGGVHINNEYILPNLDGSAGQVITTNGAGILSFTTPSNGSVTSVGITMPNAFGVANSPIVSSGTINVTALGTANQYIRGDGNLADFPIVTGGGSAVVYYFNGGTNQGTFGGGTYYELSKIANLGINADFSTATDGIISQFITDPLDPNLLVIPAGNWVFGTYFSASSSGGNPRFSFELLKWDGTTFTSIANNSANPESITGGTSIDIYFSALAVPETILLATDRLAIRVSVICDGRTITLHTQQNHLSQVTTTFSIGLTALNGLTDQVQYFQTGTSGTDFGISSSVDIHTFNLPVASATNTGKLSATDWSTFNGKADNNIYTANGTLTGSRIIDGSNFAIDFQNLDNFKINVLGLTTLLQSQLCTFNISTINLATGGKLFNIQDVTASLSRLAILKTGNVEINSAYKLPLTDGTSGQVIVTDGAGTLSWGNATANNIYNSDGTLTADRTATTTGSSLLFTGTITSTTLTFLINTKASAERFIRARAVSGTKTRDMRVDADSSYLLASDSSLGYSYKIEVNAGGVSVNNYTMPLTDGTANQVITTDGAGNLSFQAVQSLQSDYNTTTKTGASYTAVNRDYVLINASTFTLTLPTATANAQVGVKMINASVSNIQIKTPSAGVTIDGVDRSSVGLGLFNQYDAYIFICDGTNWWIMS